MVKNVSANAEDMGSIPGSGRSPGGGNKWQPTPVFLPGEESHGQRSLVGCSPWGCKESGTTERLTHTQVPLIVLDLKRSVEVDNILFWLSFLH